VDGIDGTRDVLVSVTVEWLNCYFQQGDYSAVTQEIVEVECEADCLSTMEHLFFTMN